MVHHRILPLLCAFVLALAAACTGGHDDSAPTPAPVAPMTVAEAAARGEFGVGVTTRPMVDTSRPTEANRDYPGSPQREMEVEIWYPAATASDAPEARDAAPSLAGRFPLIIFAHGYSSIRTHSASYARHLASHGYVVAAPGFPSTRLDSPGGPRLYGVLDQPADVSFVIDQLLLGNTQAFPPLPSIDPDHIGMTGHSGGGLTTLITAYGALRESRIDAIVPISPVGCLVAADIAGADTVPAMIVGGSMDLLVGPPSIRLAYEAASAPKYFVEIIGADHIRFGDFDTTDADLGDVLGRVSRGDITADAIRTAQGTGADPTACIDRTTKPDQPITGPKQRELMRAVALPFFDYYLKGDAPAKAFLEETLPGLDGIRFETTAHSQEEEQ